MQGELKHLMVCGMIAQKRQSMEQESGEMNNNCCCNCENCIKMCGMYMCREFEAYVNTTYKCGWYCKRVMEEEFDLI